MKRLLRVVGVLLCIALSTFMCFAQETLGGIRGTVQDPSGAVISQARVEVSSATIVRPMAVDTSADGSFVFSTLPPGTYNISASAPGFGTIRRSDVIVTLGKVITVSITLKVGTVAETVSVAANATAVDTQSSSSAVAVDQTFFADLPKGRSFYDLIAIAPGARQEGKAGGYEIDGASGSENTYYLDGMQMTNIQTGILSTNNQIPVEAVQQLEVKNGVVPSQYGGAMGGVVNAVVRSGSNQFHGEFGFYYNNDAMRARSRPTLELDPADPTNNTAKNFVPRNEDAFRTWEPMFTLGGPLWPNRVFFFTSYEPIRSNYTRIVDYTSGETGTYQQQQTQQFWTNKVDASPITKLHTSLSWIYNPRRTTGLLPGQTGFSDSGLPWGDEGEREASNILAGQADYVATNKLVLSFRGGYSYRNLHNRYGLSTPTAIYYSQSTTDSTEFPGIPDALRDSAGYVVGTSEARLKDIYTRNSYAATASYIFNLGGQHTIKGGWERNDLFNDVVYSSWPSGYYRFWWSSTTTPQVYNCVTDQCSTVSGAYGYYRLRNYGTIGSASSQNQGIFIADDWRVSRRLTLNLGLRMEREFVPVYGAAAKNPIEFGWGSKLAPRLGFAYDVKGDGRHKVYASFGVINDVMKYEMPRGSFGGDVWMDYMYTLDSPDVVNQVKSIGIPADPTKLPGTFGEAVNWRIPSNDPSAHLLDPNLKPVATRLFDMGYDFEINPKLVASARYTNRRLIRTIEDTGYMGADGETYMITNPSGSFPSRQEWTDMWLGVVLPMPPKPVRNYDAVEFRLDRRFASNYQFAASYTWSRLYGNYSGLASSDEDGRNSPNVNRYYDMPWVGITEKGTYAKGLLPTDRPHTFKLFGTYFLNSKVGKTSFSPMVQLYSGTPVSTEANLISTTPAFPFGRGDLGRTPVYFNTDFNISHEFMPVKNRENMKVRFDFTVFNLFNGATVTSLYKQIVHPDVGQVAFKNADGVNDYTLPFQGFDLRALMAAQDIRQDPQYARANGWQGPRNLRLRLSFSF